MLCEYLTFKKAQKKDVCNSSTAATRLLQFKPPWSGFKHGIAPEREKTRETNRNRQRDSENRLP